MKRMEERTFEFLPDLRLGLVGPRQQLRHFDAEYGRVRTQAGGAVDARVELGPLDPRGRAGGHKTARWTVELGTPTEVPLTARIGVRGLPASFALSLVQGYFVEPLLSLAAASAGYVLLPAAAIADGDDAVVLMGRSRSGKSTVSARALAAGVPILGDDQVILDGAGNCAPFPRRLRFYSDLRETAPDAFRRLPTYPRTGLHIRRLVKRVTRGFISPPVRVPISVLGPPARAGWRRISGVIVIERDAALDELGRGSVDAEHVAKAAEELLDGQRERFAQVAGPEWIAPLGVASERERSTVRAAFGSVSVERLALPGSWPAPRAIDALAQALGISGPRSGVPPRADAPQGGS